MTHGDTTSRPLFLLGPARGGTSLLYKALCLHPGTTFISNYVARAPRLPELSALSRLVRRFPDRQRDAWFNGGSNAYVYGAQRPWSRWLLPAPVEGEPVFRASGVPQLPGEPAAPVDEQEDGLRRSVARLRRADGSRVFVNKRIANNRRVPLLAGAFPTARFVRLVRDGRAVALSLSKVDWWLDDPVWWYGGTPRQWAAEGRDPWEICALNWVEELDELEAGLATVDPSQVMLISYEELVAEPQHVLHGVADFAGLPLSTTWGRQLAALTFPARSDEWQHGLTGTALETVERVQARVLERYGYLSSTGPLAPTERS